MAFYVGQKVVRVTNKSARRGDISLQDAERLGASIPREGEVVTIRAINVHPADVLLRFQEHDNNHLVAAGWGSLEPGFGADHFRPVVERKTSIEIFRAMLNPSDKRVDA